MFIRDLEGNEYFLDGVIKHEQELNGDERIDMDIKYTDRNAEFLSKQQDLSMWIITFEDKEYRIISCNQTGYGDKFKVSVTGILYILDWLNTHRIEERIDASLTVREAFDLVFNDTPFTYIIVNSAYSERFEGLGEGETKLEMFKTFIERFEYEFKIIDKVVYLYALIGNDTNFEYRYKVNASNITKEVDASEMWTYVRGYGDYREESTDSGEASVEVANDNNGEVDPTKVAKLKPGTMEGNPYISPLAKIIGIREGPSIRNANITKSETLLKQMKRVVDESVKISFSADIYDMSQVGYDYQHAEVGDRVFLVDERIGLNQEIRVVKIDREVNHLGQLLKIEITFGTSNLSDTYSSNINTAVKDIQDLTQGKTTLPFPALDIRAQSMVKVLENTNSELIFDTNGIHAIDKENINNLVTLNSSGLMLSTDGGRTARTALTAEGLVADAITSGSLLTTLVDIIGRDGLITMNGDEFVAKSNQDNRKTIISPKGMTVIRPDGAPFIVNGMFRYNSELQTTNPAPRDGQIELGSMYAYTNATDNPIFEEFFFQHKSRYLRVVGRAYLEHSSSTGYDGKITIEGAENYNIYGTKVISKSYNSDEKSVYVEINIDLGVPDYSRKHFFVRMGSTNSKTTIFFRRTICEQYDFE